MKDLMSEVFPLNILALDERLNILEQQVLSNKEKKTRKISFDANFEIKKNISFNELLGSGWKVEYQEKFSHSTTFDELANIAKKFEDIPDALICCVGKKVDCDDIELCAFGPLKDVLTPTDSKSVAKQIGEVYWYYVRSESFGFAEESNISLGSADTVSGDLRMSWHLSGGRGYRIGENKDLNSSSDYEKILLVNAE